MNERVNTIGGMCGLKEIVEVTSRYAQLTFQDIRLHQ